jgi:hypothetical protein
MPRRLIWGLAKLLEGVGLVVVLVGLFWSISFGLQEEGLKSMVYEFRGLFVGGALFALGLLLERLAARGA